MIYNYYALMVAIFRKCTPEQAFELLENGKLKRMKLNNDDIAYMVELKKELTYKEIGEMYGLSPDAVHNRIRRFKRQIS
ncbi:MAG: hypothetical protein PWQ82_1164 [Thermosediminibacterales bacterium]|nr:hypothetical protein [Thermosediminibacterales bacterium]